VSPVRSKVQDRVEDPHPREDTPNPSFNGGLGRSAGHFDVGLGSRFPDIKDVRVDLVEIRWSRGVERTSKTGPDRSRDGPKTRLTEARTLSTHRARTHFRLSHGQGHSPMTDPVRSKSIEGLVVRRRSVAMVAESRFKAPIFPRQTPCGQLAHRVKISSHPTEMGKRDSAFLAASAGR
jgi:hypothetical protein